MSTAANFSVVVAAAAVLPLLAASMDFSQIVDDEEDVSSSQMRLGASLSQSLSPSISPLLRVYEKYFTSTAPKAVEK